MKKINYPVEALKKLNVNETIVKKEKKEKNRKKRQKKKKVDYEMMSNVNPITAPVSIGYRSRNFQGSGKTMTLSNSELITSINGSVTFSNTQFVVNPGLSTTFPWLYKSAANFQMYRFHKLSFEFRPSVSTATPGIVVLSPEYNVQDHPPVSLSEASNTEGSNQGNTWLKTMCLLSVDRMFSFGRRKQIRASLVTGDLMNYDACKINVSTVDQADTSIIGYLWVHYEVELAVPQSSPLLDSLPLSTSLYANSASQTLTNATEVKVVLTSTYDPINFGSQVSGVFTPPAGSYWLSSIVQINDAANEILTAYLQVFKNNVGQDPNSSFLMSGTTSGLTQTLIAQTIVNCNGSDTIYVGVFVEFTTGPVILPSTTASLVVRAA